jgi:two-component system, NtrC family, sensor kinase
MRIVFKGTVVFLLVFLIQPVHIHAGSVPYLQYRDSINQLLHQSGHSPHIIEKLNSLVQNAFNNESDLDSLIEDAYKVLDYAIESENEVGIADAQMNLVKIYLSQFESIKSIEFALEALKVYEKHKMHDKVAYAMLQLGVIYFYQNNYNKSLDYYSKAIDHYSKSGTNKYTSTLFYLSGINYSKLKNFASAHSFFNRALQINSDLNDYRGVAECNLGLADLFIMQSQPDSAIRYIESVYHYSDTSDNSYGKAKSLILLSEAYKLQSKTNDAIKSALKGLWIADSIGARELIIDARKLLHQLHYNSGDFRNAYHYLFSYMGLRDSVINEKTSRNIARLEADYIINNKQNQILLLENQNRNRLILLIASVITGVLALLLALVFFAKEQQRKKANIKLEKAYNELETTQKQLIHHEKLASLGHLTAGIAHEIKNPLNFVNNFSQLSIDLLKELDLSLNDQEQKALIKDVSMNLEKISQHGERANSIITRMLDHSRSGEREVTKTDVNKLLQEYYSLAYQATRINHPGYQCSLITHLEEEIPPVYVVAQEISRVFLNIFNNSLYAMLLKKISDESFKPELSIETTQTDQLVRIIICDNGPGIPESILDKIFQPFFTTKPAGEGTGLGLSLSYDIINAHGGTIFAKNLPEGGACFEIDLPLTIPGK